jgi:hypothetical protein
MSAKTTHTQSQHATSPWTQAYQTRPEQDSLSFANSTPMAFDDEQLPTHDALTDVYNPHWEDNNKRVLF